jgi:hypothetical protein
LQFLFIFQIFYPKSIFFECFTWVIIHMDFVGFPFRTSKLKNNISYIKYKISHRFGKVCRWLNMYYSKIRIIIFLKITIVFFWIIKKNLVWIHTNYNFFFFWSVRLCIHPLPCCATYITHNNALKSSNNEIKRKRASLKPQRGGVTCWRMFEKLRKDIS